MASRPKAILITECLQNDFVRPVREGEELPNLLHVGARESLRLIGEDPAEGPVARLMRWANATSRDSLMIVHIVDWHAKGEERDREHLKQFGDHCLHDSSGADFAFPVSEADQDRAEIVRSPGMNDFLGTRLASLLDSLAGSQIPVGLIGVWTEAKVSFLAYELRTRYPSFQLAVSSALTASSSRARHFIALEQMERILGARVIDSIGEFIAFLGGDASYAGASSFNLDHPALKWDGPPAGNPTDDKLIRWLFRDCREVNLKPLSGGFSGNLVLMARGLDAHGRQQVPHVVKVGEQKPIGQERAAFEQIEPVLGNNAPRIADYADLAGRGALKYRYASMGGGDSTTFQKLYVSGAPSARVREVLDEVFKDQLGRLYSAATLESVDLLDYYAFSPKWAPSVAAKVEAVMGAAGKNPELEFPGGRRARNVRLFYEQDLAARNPALRRSHYFAHVHGDLNGANIIIDGKGNVWIIDFFHAHRGHVLRDLIKLENDLLFIFTPIENEAEFEEALALSDVLLGVTDLSAPLPGFAPRSPALRRAYEAASILRSYYSALLREDRDPFQLHVAVLRYAVHTLSFDESSPLQKHWSLYTACRAADKVIAALA